MGLSRKRREELHPGRVLITGSDWGLVPADDQALLAYMERDWIDAVPTRHLVASAPVDEVHSRDEELRRRRVLGSHPNAR